MKIWARAAVALLTVVNVVSATAGISYLDSLPITANDARRTLLDERALKAVDLSDGSLFVTRQAEGFEPFAIAGSVVNRDGSVRTYRATDWLPPGFVARNTAGQIFGATLLEDGDTLAVSIGWTNASGRNINGIALLNKTPEGWTPRSTIVVRGSVREVVASSGNRIAAITVDPERAAFSVNLTVFNLDGSVYAMKNLGGSNADVSNERALRMNLQRAAKSVVVFDTEIGTVVEYGSEVTTHSDCSRASRRGPEGFFLYPVYASRPCTLTAVRLGSIAALPEESRFAKALSIKAVHMNSDGSYSVVREAWDGTKTHILLSTYGRPEGLRTVVAPAAWSAVRLGDGVARASEKRGGETYLVNAAMP